MAVQFDLVSPERLCLRAEASEVQIPGADGDLTAMENHAPMVTTLRPGVIKARVGGVDKAYIVTGGFAEINASHVTILAEQAVPVEESNAALLDQMLQDMIEASAFAVDQDAAEKNLADMRNLKEKFG